MFTAKGREAKTDVQIVTVHLNHLGKRIVTSRSCAVSKLLHPSSAFRSVFEAKKINGTVSRINLRYTVK